MSDTALYASPAARGLRAFAPLARFAHLALAAALLTAASAASAQQAGPLQVDVVDRSTGRTLPVYQHRGELWVEGRPGARYGLRIHNRSGERILAIESPAGTG